MYTYVHPGFKKVNTVTYVHKGGVSNAYSRIRTARARVHGEAAMASCSSAANRLGQNRETALSSCSWGVNGMRRVHREATKRVGANRLGRNNRWKRGLAYRRTEEMTLCPTSHGQNGILFIRRGLATAKQRKWTFVGPPTVETGSC